MYQESSDSPTSSEETTIKKYRSKKEALQEFKHVSKNQYINRDEDLIPLVYLFLYN